MGIGRSNKISYIKFDSCNNIIPSEAKEKEAKLNESVQASLDLKQNLHSKVFCNNCQQYGFASLERTLQTSAYAWSFIFFIFITGILWSWLPFVLEDFKQTTYYCRNCKKKLQTDKQKIKKQTENLFSLLLGIEVLLLLAFSVYNLVYHKL